MPRSDRPHDLAGGGRSLIEKVREATLPPTPQYETKPIAISDERTIYTRDKKFRENLWERETVCDRREIYWSPSSIC